MMKAIKNLFFFVAVLTVFSFAAYAQKSDDKKEAPKKPPVKIEPRKEKEKPKENPPSNDRNNFVPPKKPNDEASGILGLITNI